MSGRANLLKAFDLFKIQGFESSEELFLVGYIMAHGGELYMLEQINHDLDLLAHDANFWKEIVDDCQKIRLKVVKDDVEKAKAILVELIQKRNGRIPMWLEKKERRVPDSPSPEEVQQK